MTTTQSMASAIFIPPHFSSTSRKPNTLFSLSTSLNSKPNSPNFPSLTSIPQLGLTPLSTWNGLRQQGASISPQFLKLEKRRKCRGKGVFASLFGVGAPEALVIGVVALLVFGPKGLAEVARNLGKTLRSFQPTIKELQEVSREFKSTLEKEIGLDDSQNPAQSNYSSSTRTLTSRPSPDVTSEDSQTTVDPMNVPLDIANGSASPNKAYSSEDYLKITEEQLKAAASFQESEQTASSPKETQPEPKTESKDTVQEVATTIPPAQKPERET